MATGTWIYEVGSAQGGSGDASASIPDPPPVTIDETLTSVGEIENGQMEIVVHWKPDATANPDNFTGVEVYLEDPDISDKPSPKLDGTVKLGDATTPTTQKSGELAIL